MADRPLGRKQLNLLATLGDPFLRMLHGDNKVAASLTQRGLLDADDAGWRITPAGLRRLADELDAGRLDEWVAR